MLTSGYYSNYGVVKFVLAPDDSWSEDRIEGLYKPWREVVTEEHRKKIDAWSLTNDRSNANYPRSRTDPFHFYEDVLVPLGFTGIDYTEVNLYD